MSMSRTIATWVASLTLDDLPNEVIDRAKGVTLQALSSALLGYSRPEAHQALSMMREEEMGGGGAATCLVTGAKLTKAGAALVNAETIFAGGKWDTFRMLTHPGCAILPAALAACDPAWKERQPSKPLLGRTRRCGCLREQRANGRACPCIAAHD